MSLKVLFLSTSDMSGGAGIAAYRLHRALIDNGVSSQMLVQNKQTDDYTVISTADTNIKKIINRFRPELDQIPVKFYRKRSALLFSPSRLGFSNIVSMINKVNPDVVHIHWVCGGFLKIEDVAKIKYPVIWSLHDNWPFTGGCHVKLDCKKYLDKCGSCPELHAQGQNDLSRKVWNRKKRAFKKLNNFVINGVSKWIMNASKESSLFQDKKHCNIPNPINTDVFKPFPKDQARTLWRLPEGKQFILFGAINAVNDPNKGFHNLLEALNLLQLSDVELIVLGMMPPKDPPPFKFKAHYIGYLHDVISLKTIYSVADVTVIPSSQENLSNTIMESLSCATPVVAFDVGGNRELVEHKKNGYLARSSYTRDLAKGVEWVLESKEYDKLSHNAREKVLAEFDSKIVVPKYIDLYHSLLK